MVSLAKHSFVVLALAGLCLLAHGSPAAADSPWYERPQDWGKNGIVIFPPAGNDTSGLDVMTAPWIDHNGTIWSGSSNTAQQQSPVGKATLTHGSDGRAYWVSSYSNYNGRVASPVRAPAYDQTLTVITCSFINRTNDIVGFSLGGSDYRQGYRLGPQQSGQYQMSVAVGQTPFVRISQLGGGSRDFSLANGGSYAFQVNPSSGQIDNYYQ